MNHKSQFYSVSGISTLETWINALRALRSNNKRCHLLIDISKPSYYESGWLKNYNPKNIDPEKPSIHDVVNTIFPVKLYKRIKDRNKFYQRYKKIYQRGKKRRKNRAKWGTYFLRLICFGDKKINQLEEIITRMNKFPKKKHHAVYKLCLSSPETDTIKDRGNPCWQYGQFICSNNNKLDLFVVYRSHDYFSKALGNFIALGQLLDFVCKHVNKKPGHLICHSAYAFHGANQSNIDKITTTVG